MMSRSSIPDDIVLLAHILSAPPGSRWRERDLEQGMTLAYGSGAQHAAANMKGLVFAFAVTTCDELRGRSEQLRVSTRIPARGVLTILPSRTYPPFVEKLRHIAALSDRTQLTKSFMDDLLSAMALTLTRAEDQHHGRRRPLKMDSCRIVRDCVDRVQSIGRLPSMGELCAVSQVSERRLRGAFISVHGVPPSVFFRNMMLTEAHRRLAAGEKDSLTVTSVAIDLGFDHLSRFSHYYAQLNGELPSATLSKPV